MTRPTCRRCGGEMHLGLALVDVYGGSPDFPGGEVVTVSPTGKAELVEVLKCADCGASQTTGEPT